MVSITDIDTFKNWFWVLPSWLDDCGLKDVIFPPISQDSQLVFSCNSEYVVGSSEVDESEIFLDDNAAIASIDFEHTFKSQDGDALAGLVDLQQSAHEMFLLDVFHRLFGRFPERQLFPFVLPSRWRVVLDFVHLRVFESEGADHFLRLFGFFVDFDVFLHFP